MKCPHCGHCVNQVKDSRDQQNKGHDGKPFDTKRRRRKCMKCGRKFTTIEVPLEYVKNDSLTVKQFTDLALMENAIIQAALKIQRRRKVAQQQNVVE